MRLPIVERAVRYQRCGTVQNAQYVVFPVFFPAPALLSIILFYRSPTAAIINKIIVILYRNMVSLRQWPM